MNDFEDRLTTALRSAGDDAPEAAGLAPAARGRARARSRRTALASVAAVVAVASVVGGAAWLGNRDGAQTATPSTDGATEATSTPPDTPVSSTRLESWRDLSVQVPTEWGRGTLDDWCSGGDLEVPVVERPGASVDILCTPVNGYGVRFFDGSAVSLAYEPGHIWKYEKGDLEEYPDGSWLGYQRGSGDNLVWVVAKDRATVEQVLGSFVRSAALDPLGCAVQRGGDEGERQLPAGGELRLCRYDIDGWLEQSELLTGVDATDAVAALESAPEKGERMCTAMVEGPTIVVTGSDAEGQVTLDACQGFSWAGRDHDLTADVLYWALSPGWSGGVAEDVPMPGSFRR